MREDCGGLVVANLQTRSAVPFLTAARRLGIPVVGYVSSWDHTVGKGAISPYASRYVVQNETMRRDLERYHGIEPSRVEVTGWPQTDVFHERRPRARYDELVRGSASTWSRPLVLVMGNTPTNAPYEDRFVARLLGWWQESGAHERFQLLFRPHPRDRRWRERFALPRGRPARPCRSRRTRTSTTLATLLQHGDAVVANAGNDPPRRARQRPARRVRALRRGRAARRPLGELNVSGEHYRELIESEAFYRARSFEEVVAGIERPRRPGGARGRAGTRGARRRRRGGRARRRPRRGRDRDHARAGIASAAVARTVLFVGAGRHQRRAIERAQELGLRVVAVDRNPDALGLQAADVAEVVDFSDVEARGASGGATPSTAP